MDIETPSGTSMAEHAFQQLRDRLIFLDIAPGEPIVEARLCEELNVGRTPVREALKRLEVDGLVRTFARRGTFATTVDITTLSEISEVRETLEPLAARYAAQRLTGEGRQELETLKVRLAASSAKDSDDPQDALRWDSAVHRAIYRAAGNAHLDATLVRYANLATRIWAVAATRTPTPHEHVAVHDHLLDAVLNGRAHDAEHIMREHVREFEQYMREVL